LYELLSPYGFSTIDKIAEALKGQSGKQFFSSSHQLLVDREFIFISEVDVKKNELMIIQETTNSIKNPIHLNFSKSYNVKWKDDLNSAQLDFEKLQFPLTLRKWKEGDKFIPLGMKTFKKLSDYFIDNKFSLLEKKKQWLLCSGKDIIWVVGHRIDNRYKLESKTKKVYIAQLLD
jgi:tRNA(Ile)-lysidine synthase